MKKVFLFIALALLFMGATVGAYAWWDSLEQNRDETLEIGYGVRLVVDSELQDTRELVPAGSFYAAYEADYTTQYVFEYELSLEEPLKTGMLANLSVDLSDFVMGLYEHGFNNPSSVLSIDVNGLVEDANGSWTIANAFTDSDNLETITITFTLASNGEAFADHYAAVAGQTPSFNVSFLVENASSSLAPENPLA